MRPWLSLFASLVLGSLLTSTAHAAPPDATNSVVPCLVLCPDGDIPFTVVVKDVASNPVPNATVQLSWCEATGVSICFLTICSTSGLTNAAGSVTFNLKIGGVSAGALATIHADAVPLATRFVASPDQNGDLMVNGADVVIANGKLGLADPTMDLDCDLGPVSNDDLAFQLEHYGHNCDAPVPALPKSWGRVKTLYR